MHSKANVNVDEGDEESRGNHEEEQPQRKDAAMARDLAMKEGRRNVMKASPILAAGVWETSLLLFTVQQGDPCRRKLLPT